VTELDEEERLQALGAAVTCAILGPAGPARSRLLATLYRDERSQHLEQHPILAATFLDHIIRPALVKQFEASLRPHQLAKLPPLPKPISARAADEAQPGQKRGPETVLDRAVMEHNLLSASRIYSNITFAGLGALLSLTPSAAEAMARTMIQQTRLKASIDQVERCIMFDPAAKELEGAVSNVAKAAQPADEDDERLEEEVHADETVRWDMDIRRTTQAVEDLAIRCRLLSASLRAALRAQSDVTCNSDCDGGRIDEVERAQCPALGCNVYKITKL
jgi:COP9 signalosome complex subunit 4